MNKEFKKSVLLQTIITNVDKLKMNKLTDTEKRVISTVKNHMELSGDEVTLDKAFVDDLGCDSISTIEILMRIEEEFKIEIEDDLFLGDNYEAFTLAEIVLMVDDRLNGE